MTKPRKKNGKAVHISLNPKPKGDFKRLGGSMADDWNMRLFNLTSMALPINQSDIEEKTQVGTAVAQAIVDIAPADPVEGILIAQLMAASEASLSLYRRGWQNVPEYFEAGTKFLQLADKAARTVMMLTERLDHHRGRGQQRITAKHVTTNNVTADQAIITENVTNGVCRAAAPTLLAARSEAPPMPILDETWSLDPVRVGRVEKTK